MVDKQKRYLQLSNIFSSGFYYADQQQSQRLEPINGTCWNYFFVDSKRKEQSDPYFIQLDIGFKSKITADKITGQ